jgi:C4-dicarboxylate-specific signal transduction histidine kinase
VGLRNVPVNSSEPHLRPEKAARLDAMQRLSMGAAHTLNNAFTTVIGEASFLLEDRKDDDLVVESCQSILAELERCAKLTRALLARRHPNQAGSGEVEMVRLIRELEEVLSETLGRKNQLRVDAPDDILMVGGDAGDLELLVLTLVHYAADRVEGPTRLLLSVGREPTGEQIRLSLAVEGSDSPETCAEAILDPSQAPDEIACISLENAARIVRAHGGSRYASATGPDSWTALIHLPELLDDDSAS